MNNFPITYSDTSGSTDHYIGISAYPSYDRYAKDNYHYRPIVIKNIIPFEWAYPLYGHLLPLAVCFSATINIFMLTVLLHRHLRNPINYILVAISINDLLTGLCGVIWPLYYYTMEGYKIDETVGLDYEWCVIFIWFFKYLPLSFHSASSWITVFLAIQRYYYISNPSKASKYCSNRKTFIVVILINSLTFLSTSPESFGMYLVILTSHYAHHSQKECFYYVTPFVYNNMSDVILRKAYFWVRSILSLIPCVLLTIYTFKLACTMKKAEKKKRSIIQQSGSRKASVVAGGRNVRTTNKVLFFVCGWFLIFEVPMVIAQIGNFLTFTPILSNEIWVPIYNRITIVRNLMLVLFAPGQFTIYCLMSRQFRVTARQYFTKTRLYTVQVQNTPTGGKRYNMVILEEKNINQDQEQKGFFKRMFSKNEKEIIPKRKNGNVKFSKEIPLQSTGNIEIIATLFEETEESAV